MRSTAHKTRTGRWPPRRRASLAVGAAVAAACSFFVVGPEAPASATRSTGVAVASRARVHEAVSGFESPPTKELLDSLGRDVPPRLMELANDEAVWRIGRGRALAALGFYPSDEVVSFLEARLRDPDADFYLERAAMRGFVTAIGGRDPSRAFAAIRPLLRAADFRVREGAARAFAGILDPRVPRTLEHRLAVERHRAVVPTLMASLRAARSR